MRSCNWVAVDAREGSSSDPICSYSNWTLFSSRIPLVRARFWRCCLNATIPGEELNKILVRKSVNSYLVSTANMR